MDSLAKEAPISECEIFHIKLKGLSERPEEWSDPFNSPEFSEHENYPRGQLVRAQCLSFLGQMEEAEAICDKLIREDQEVALALNIYTRCLVHRGAYEKASQILAANAPHVASHQGLVGRLAILFHILGQKKNASILVRQICLSRPEQSQRHILFSAKLRETLIQMPPALRPKHEAADCYLSEKNQKDGWKQYENEYLHFQSPFQSESATLWTTLKAHLEPLLSEKNGITRVINFGCLFGGFDEELASTFPHVRFMGYDRSELAVRLNTEKFRQPNLVFKSGDFASAAKQFMNDEKTLLIHSRVGMLLFPDQLDALYATCHSLNVDRVVGLEFFSFSERSQNFPDFDCADEKASVPLGGQLILHNYRHYLEKCGYDYSLSERMPLICEFPSLDPKFYCQTMELFDGVLKKAP